MKIFIYRHSPTEFCFKTKAPRRRFVTIAKPGFARVLNKNNNKKQYTAPHWKQNKLKSRKNLPFNAERVTKGYAAKNILNKRLSVKYAAPANKNFGARRYAGKFKAKTAKSYTKPAPASLDDHKKAKPIVIEMSSDRGNLRSFVEKRIQRFTPKPRGAVVRAFLEARYSNKSSIVDSGAKGRGVATPVINIPASGFFNKNKGPQNLPLSNSSVS
jgi:hypothetical protein